MRYVCKWYKKLGFELGQSHELDEFMHEHEDKSPDVALCLIKKTKIATIYKRNYI